MLGEEMITVLMPVRVSASRLDRDFTDDFERCRLSLHLLNKFWSDDTVLRVAIVTPTDDLAVWAGLDLKAMFPKLELEIFEDSFLLGAEIADDPTVSGSIKQQLIKIGFSRVAKSPFFLTMDTDCYLIKNLSSRQILDDGKALMQMEPVAAHSEWWVASAAVLGSEIDFSDAMSVTPALLSAEIMRRLITHLETSNVGDWRQTLIKARRDNKYWTEYSLYYTFAMSAALVPRFHFFGPNRRLFTSSVWRPGAIQQWSLSDAQARPGFFTVLQSSAGVTSTEARKVLQPLLG